MQSVSSRIWTRVAVSISYDDNDYTTDTSINVLICMLDGLCECVLSQPLCHKQDVKQSQFLSRLRLVWIQFSFSKRGCHTKAIEHSLFWNWPVVGFVPFPMVLVLCEMQTATSRTSVGWGCRIHWLHRCSGVRPPFSNVLDMTLNNLLVRLPGPFWPQSSSTEYGPI